MPAPANLTASKVNPPLLAPVLMPTTKHKTPRIPMKPHASSVRVVAGDGLVVSIASPPSVSHVIRPVRDAWRLARPRARKNSRKRSLALGPRRREQSSICSPAESLTGRAQILLAWQPGGGAHAGSFVDVSIPAARECRKSWRKCVWHAASTRAPRCATVPS
jgi:hypothetical protein